MSCNGCTPQFSDYYSENTYTWCTNCGNYGIAAAEKRALVASEVDPKDAVLCFDVGCHGNGSDKIGGYRIHGLHGRVIPVAAGVAIANRELTVIAHGGDGGTLSEGINHLIHAIRNNYNLTFLLHNNQNYGLTKGQASATTPQDIPMTANPDGVSAETLDVMSLVMSLNPTFVGRGFSGDVKGLTDVIVKGIAHQGFSFIEILQSCPTYNKQTPHEWYMQNTQKVEQLDDYDPYSYTWANNLLRKPPAKIPLGLIYQNLNRPHYLDRLANRQNYKTNLTEEVKPFHVNTLLEDLR